MIKRALVLAVAVAGWGGGGEAGAVPPPVVITSPSYLYSFAGITNDIFANTFPVDVEDFNTVGSTSAFGEFFPMGTLVARGQANAGYGVLGASAQAFGQAPANTIPGIPGGYAAVAGSIFTDGYTINGGSGTAFTSTTLSGTVSPAADSLMAYVLFKSASPFTNLEALEIAAGEIIYTGMLPAGMDVVHAAIATPALALANPVLTGSYSYLSGATVYLAGVLVTFAEESGAASFLTTATFGISAPAGGTLGTLSGITYAQAVPEPGTWAMMLGGIALLGFVVRRRLAA